jgi:archaellum component FlaC
MNEYHLRKEIERLEAVHRTRYHELQLARKEVNRANARYEKMKKAMRRMTGQHLVAKDIDAMPEYDPDNPRIQELETEVSKLKTIIRMLASKD